MANKTHGTVAEIETVPLTIEERMLRLQERQLELQEAAVAAQQAQADVQRLQLKQTAPKSNQMAPQRSPYNLRGDKDYPLPPLKCDIYAPWKEAVNAHQLDREEVELFNLLQPGAYTIELNDGASCLVNVVAEINRESGGFEKLSLFGTKDSDTGQYNGLFTSERRGLFPSLKVMLRSMIGDPADVVMTMRREADLIRSGALAVSQGE